MVCLSLVSAACLSSTTALEEGLPCSARRRRCRFCARLRALLWWHDGPSGYHPRQLRIRGGDADLSQRLRRTEARRPRGDAGGPCARAGADALFRLRGGAGVGDAGPRCGAHETSSLAALGAVARRGLLLDLYGPGAGLGDGRQRHARHHAPSTWLGAGGADTGADRRPACGRRHPLSRCRASGPPLAARLDRTGRRPGGADDPSRDREPSGSPP